MRDWLRFILWTMRRTHRYEVRLPDGAFALPLRRDDSITIRDGDDQIAIIIYHAGARETWVTVLGGDGE